MARFGRFKPLSKLGDTLSDNDLALLEPNCSHLHHAVQPLGFVPPQLETHDLDLAHDDVDSDFALFEPDLSKLNSRVQPMGLVSQQLEAELLDLAHDDVS